MVRVAILIDKNLPHFFMLFTLYSMKENKKFPAGIFSVLIVSVNMNVLCRWIMYTSIYCVQNIFFNSTNTSYFVG